MKVFKSKLNSLLDFKHSNDDLDILKKKSRSQIMNCNLNKYDTFYKSNVCGHNKAIDALQSKKYFEKIEDISYDSFSSSSSPKISPNVIELMFFEKRDTTESSKAIETGRSTVSTGSTESTESIGSPKTHYLQTDVGYKCRQEQQEQQEPNKNYVETCKRQKLKEDVSQSIKNYKASSIDGL
jgi:hypothetical protein